MQHNSRCHAAANPVVMSVQVIPPGGTAKLTITLAATKVQHYQQMVEYFLNGCHIFTFQVMPICFLMHACDSHVLSQIL